MDIPKFERLNNVSISVYRYQERKEDREGFVSPLKGSKEVSERYVDLLLIANDDTLPLLVHQRFWKVGRIAVFKSYQQDIFLPLLLLLVLNLSQEYMIHCKITSISTSCH